MSKEIKVGDWVRVSGLSEDDAQQTFALYQVTEFTNNGRVIARGLSWKYAVHPDDVKVLPIDEYKALIENQIPSIENLEAGQELNHYQVLKWIEKHGSTKGLQCMSLTGLWVDDENTLTRGVDTDIRYRVAPKKVSDPDDPATWEKGVAIFRRDWEDDSWVLDVFSSYRKNYSFEYCSDNGEWRYAKLATPEQIEAWKLINDENC